MYRLRLLFHKWHVLSTEETGKYVIKLSGVGLVDFLCMNVEITGYDYLTFV